MNKSLIDLMREYIRVADMCDVHNREYGDDIKPWSCVRYNGASLRNNGAHPHLNGVPDGYEFAVTVIDSAPVFVGDNIYDRKGVRVTVAGSFKEDIICKYNEENELYIHPKRLTLYAKEHNCD